MKQEHKGISRVIVLDRVDSTNRWLKEHGAELPHGTVCYTDWQEAGRGRLGRSWTVPAGQTVAMSFLFRRQEDWGWLPLVCGLAVSDALQRLTGEAFLIKWPNDILCRERKVCGILCESRAADGEWLAVAGMGINLSQTAAWFEEAGLPYGGSIRMLTGTSVSPKEAVAAVADALNDWWELHRKGETAALKAEYTHRCVNIGRLVRVLGPDGTARCEGKAVGIAQDGALEVETEQGRIVIRAGEASVRGLYGYI